jgi:ribose-phosphate pyrophosphokinase
MRTIYRESSDRVGINAMLYPDNQPHINVPLALAEEGEIIRLVWKLQSALDLVQLAQIANVLTHRGVIKQELVIPYLMGARGDRAMIPGDSVDLEVVASIINACGFNKVIVFDVHNEVAAKAFIPNLINVDASVLVREYQTKDSVLIVPDAGAAKKAEKYIAWNPNLVDVVYCLKTRDLANRGKLTLKVLEPERCQDRNCVVIDDLCDAGGTFLGIASQIDPASLTLIVSHGLFSKGVKALLEKYPRIITSNSYEPSHTEFSPLLHIVDISLYND